MRVRFFVSFCVLISVFNLNARVIQTDICIYGGTSAGVISAVSADWLGKKTLIIEPSNHLGGLSVGGLGETDIGNKYAVTSISRDFYRQLGKYYGEFEMWKFEPHVAETLLLKNPLLNGTKPEVLVDNSDLKQVKTAGNWEISKQKHASYKMDYLLTQSNGNSTESVTFFPKLVHAGMYEVYFYCPEKPTNSPEWAESVTVKIFDGKIAKNLTVNQKIHSHNWVKLGEFNLASNKKPYVEVVADKTGVAIADALIFVPKK